MKLLQYIREVNKKSPLTLPLESMRSNLVCIPPSSFKSDIACIYKHNLPQCYKLLNGNYLTQIIILKDLFKKLAKCLTH